MAGTRKRAAAWELVSGSVEETHALGERLGRLLQPGDVLAFQGELGSGKTTLIQGLALGMGCTSVTVKSPTFVLMREYPGPVPLVHMDAYRLEGAPAAAWLDVDFIFSPAKITVIEWAERVGDLLPADHLAVHLEHVSTNRRRLTLRASGPRGEALVNQLKAEAPPVPAAAPADEEPVG